MKYVNKILKLKQQLNSSIRLLNMNSQTRTLKNSAEFKPQGYGMFEMSNIPYPYV